jgi:S-formylglutathione hydrolase FrmB
MRSTTSAGIIASAAVAAVLGFHGIAGIALQAQAPAAPGGRGGQAGAAAARGPGGAAAAPSTSGSKVERIKVYGASLQGNLEGDDPNRDVVVYLPPSYSKEPNRRYPAVYFLHGYAARVDAYVNLLRLQEAADRSIADGGKEIILVLPDAFTVYSGSMYSNSPVTGDWEGYISRDLVGYIDSHYRTVADRDSRGLSGHSMGGYGTMRVGMKHPEVFSVLYSMSACCLMNNPFQQPAVGQRGTGAPAPAPAAAATPAEGNTASGTAPGAATAPAQGRGEGRGQRGGAMANAMSAQAAAWAPNPMNPPQYFDLPTKDGELQPLIAAKWLANSPLVMVDQYVPSLKRYRAIDVGDKDPLGASNIDLDKALTRLGVSHTFDLYDGDHGNRVGARFVSHLLPFFSKQLK